MSHFVFFVRLFLTTLANYAQIYSILVTSSDQLCFDDEKQLIKSIQRSIFQTIKTTSGPSPQFGFDLEILSLNLISNALLTLRQFEALLLKPKLVIDLKIVAKLLGRLEALIRTNRINLEKLNKLAVELDSDTDFSDEPSRTKSKI